MRLLIITSELLNPANTLGSTFELSQAQILSEKFDTAILSVSAGDSLSAAMTAFIKKLAFRDRHHYLSGIIKRLSNAVLSVILQKRIVAKYTIEGINVYEGALITLISKRGFKKNLDLWTNTGYAAFKTYCREHGEPDIVHAHGRFLNAGVLALHIKKNNRINYIYTEHSTYFKRGIAPVESKNLLNAVIDNAYVYSVVSKSLLDDVERFLDKQIDKALIVPNALDKIFEQPLANENTGSENPFVFLNVAALEEKKGHDILIRAFAGAFRNDPGCILYICGDGPLQNELVALRDKLGLNELVIFTGRKTKMEVREILDRSQVFVLSSRVETFGVVVMEALSRGLPVIATRCGGPEYQVDDYSGILIDPDNIEQLSTALKKMKADYLHYDHRAIRQNAINKYGSSAYLNTMSLLYNSIQK